MASRDLYHGADATKLLFNIRNGSLTADSQGRLFFAEREWQNCFVHGADTQLGESYAAKFRVEIPDGANLAQAATSGNRDALILTLTPGAQVRAQILELRVRRGRVGSFETVTIPQTAVQSYLEGKIASVQALAKIKDQFERLSNAKDLTKSEHAAQLNLIRRSLNPMGRAVQAFNPVATPELSIWNAVEETLDTVGELLDANNVPKAGAFLLAARLQYLVSLRQFVRWKDGFETGARRTNVAIGVISVAIILTAVAAFAAAAGGAAASGAAAGGAATGGGATGGATAAANAAQALERLQLLSENADNFIRIASSEGEPVQIIEEIVRTASAMP
jgi:hypothetical protein